MRIYINLGLSNGGGIEGIDTERETLERPEEWGQCRDVLAGRSCGFDRVRR